MRCLLLLSLLSAGVASATTRTLPIRSQLVRGPHQYYIVPKIAAGFAHVKVGYTIGQEVPGLKVESDSDTTSTGLFGIFAATPDIRIGLGYTMHKVDGENSETDQTMIDPSLTYSISNNMAAAIGFSMLSEEDTSTNPNTGLSQSGSESTTLLTLGFSYHSGNLDAGVLYESGARIVEQNVSISEDPRVTVHGLFGITPAVDLGAAVSQIRYSLGNDDLFKDAMSFELDGFYNFGPHRAGLFYIMSQPYHAKELGKFPGNNGSSVIGLEGDLSFGPALITLQYVQLMFEDVTDTSSGQAVKYTVDADPGFLLGLEYRT